MYTYANRPYPIAEMFSSEELNTLPDRIRAERLARHLGYPKDVAKLAGMSEKEYSDIEWGIVKPTLEQVERIAVALQCTPYTLTRLM